TLIGVAFTLQGIAWLVVPERAAAGLGMPLLAGLGRSTQIGDFAAFFLVLGASILAGLAPGYGHRLYFPAALLGSAAVCRTAAWAVQGAAFAVVFITAELGTCLLLLAVARHRGNA